MPSTVKQHLIWVTVTFDLHGTPTYTTRSLFDANTPTDQFNVAPGHLVAWYVQANNNDGTIAYPPFDLAFSNPLFFGTGSLAVPAGGYSPYLQALALKGQTKFTLTVTGITPPLDPVIIIDPGGRGPAQLAVAAYEICWDISGGTALEWRQSDKGNWMLFSAAPLPLLNPGDTVLFLVLSNPVQQFFVSFDLDQPGTPFVQGTGYTDPGNQPYKDGDNVNYEATILYTVAHLYSSTNQTFGFEFQLQNSGAESDHQQMTVKAG